MFIDDRNFPGGPIEYLVKEYSFPVSMMGNAVFPIQIWLCDGLMIYRLLLIYGFDYRLIIIPVLLLLGSFSMGSIILNQELVGHTGFWSKSTINFAIPFFSLSITLNFLVTILIVARLLYLRRQSRKAMGGGYFRDEVSVSAMFVESALLTTTFSLIFLVPYARNHPVANIFQGLVFYAQTAASMLITLRVAHGVGWSKATTTSVFPLVSLTRDQPSASKANQDNESGSSKMV